MSPTEARKYLASLRQDQGAPPTDPSSMEEVLAIIRNDDIRRFEGATRFTEGMQGVEALSVRATIELMQADIYATGETLVEELGRRASQELDRLSEKEKGGIQLSEQEKLQKKESDDTRNRLDKAGVALRVLADEHRTAGGSLAQEAIKQYPKAAEGYQVGAYYYLLKFDWLRYDDMMAPLEAAGVDEAAISYFRALENLHRNSDKENCRAYLREALTKNPALVRAQAQLVLVQDDIDTRYAELQTLKKMKADHPIVNIAGIAIEREYEISMSVRNARTNPQPQ
jgi:hypothetical protein